MAWKHYVAVMPGNIFNNTSWLDDVGSNTNHVSTGAPSGSWNLVQVVPISPITDVTGSGQVVCYFVSGSY